MKRMLVAAAVCVLVFCGCQAGEMEEALLTYTDELSKVQEIDIIPDDCPDIVETLYGEEELENFVKALDLSKWKEGALSQEAEKSGTFLLRLVGDNAGTMEEDQTGTIAEGTAQDMPEAAEENMAGARTEDMTETAAEDIMEADSSESAAGDVIGTQAGAESIGELFVYKSVPYVAVRIAGMTMSFEVPEETAEYLNSYFE